ncbi:MAG: hypothetical protein U0359_08310 [Byssovorax sp.]
MSSPPPYTLFSFVPVPFAGPLLLLTTQGTVAASGDPVADYADIPARHLDLGQATAILDKLAERKQITFKKRNIRGISTMSWGVVVQDFPLDGVSFNIVGNWSSAIDPRLAVLVYRLVVYLRGEGATGMVIGYDRGLDRPELSSHNQGRAFDFHAVLFEHFVPGANDYLQNGALDARLLTVQNHWGKLPVRDESGAAILNGKVPWTGRAYYDRGKPHQDRLARFLDAATKVDRYDLAAVLGPASDPGEGPFDDATKAKADKLEAQLRRAATIFDGAFRLCVKEGTIDDTSPSEVFNGRDLTAAAERLFGKPISRTNSGNICEPDGSMFDYHQDHLHVQIGVTGWASTFDGDAPQKPKEIAPDIRQTIYSDTSNVIWGKFVKAHAAVEAAANKAHEAFVKKHPAPKPGSAAPAQPPPRWDDQPEYFVHQTKLTIASAYNDSALKARITTNVVANDADLVSGGDAKWSTKRGRVLNRWYSLVRRSADWFAESGWYKDPTLTEAQMKLLPAAEVRRRLLARINAGLDEAEARGLASSAWESSPGAD